MRHQPCGRNLRRSWRRGRASDRHERLDLRPLVTGPPGDTNLRARRVLAGDEREPGPALNCSADAGQSPMPRSAAISSRISSDGHATPPMTGWSLPGRGIQQPGVVPAHRSAAVHRRRSGFLKLPRAGCPRTRACRTPPRQAIRDLLAAVRSAAGRQAARRSSSGLNAGRPAQALRTAPAVTGRTVDAPAWSAAPPCSPEPPRVLPGTSPTASGPLRTAALLCRATRRAERRRSRADRAASPAAVPARTPRLVRSSSCADRMSRGRICVLSTCWAHVHAARRGGEARFLRHGDEVPEMAATRRSWRGHRNRRGPPPVPAFSRARSRPSYGRTSGRKTVKLTAAQTHTDRRGIS